MIHLIFFICDRFGGFKINKIPPKIKTHPRTDPQRSGSFKIIQPQIANAKKELKSSKQEIANAEAELEKSRAEFNSKIEEAEGKLIDAKEKVSDIWD